MREEGGKEEKEEGEQRGEGWTVRGGGGEDARWRERREKEEEVWGKEEEGQEG